MILQEQVTSVELSNKLKKLNITEPSIFFRDWTGAKEDEIEQNSEPLYNIDNVNCYTVAELGEMLPADVFSGRRKTTKEVDPNSEVIEIISCWYNGFKGGEEFADTEANARAKMLIYLIENKLV